MYFLLVAFAVLGAGLKYIDDAFDEKIFNKKIAYVVAPILGMLWAYTMFINVVSATILLAILLGVLLKGKIDNYAHFMGMVVVIAGAIVLGVQLLLIPLVILTLAALFDEVGNDFIDKRHYIPGNNVLKKSVGYFFDQRWLTKVVILGLAFTKVIPFYFFLAMLFFDGAYILMRGYSQFKLRKLEANENKNILKA
jgi:hypothetical protein